MSCITGTDFQPLTEELSACQLCAGKQQANLPGADGASLSYKYAPTGVQYQQGCTKGQKFIN